MDSRESIRRNLRSQKSFDIWPYNSVLRLASSLQGGEDLQDVLSIQVTFRKTIL